MAVLRQVKMVNCQCWKTPRIINFTEGLNVIRSTKNSVGKSVLFKGLKFTITPYMFDKDDRLDFITHGRDYAELTYLFDTDEVAIVRVLPDKVIYFYSKSLANPKFTQTVDYPPEELIKALSVLIEPMTGYIINVIDSDRPLFLTDSDNETNVNIIKFMTEHKHLNRLKENYESKTSELNDALAKVYRKELEYKDRIQKLNIINVASLEERINLAEAMTKVFDACAKIYTLLDSLPKSKNSVRFYEKQIELCDLGMSIENSGILNVNANVRNNITDMDIRLANTLVELQNTGIFEANTTPCKITDTDISLANLIMDLEKTGILESKLNKNEISDNDIAYAKLAENLETFIVNTTFEEKPFKYYGESLDLVDVLQAVMKSYNGAQTVKKLKHKCDEKLTEIKYIEKSIRMAEKLLPLELKLNELIDLNNKYKESIKTIKAIENELDSIVNNNEVLDCPIHGKIVNKNGVCIPVLKSPSNIVIKQEKHEVKV